MTDSSRSVTLRRTSFARFEATNADGTTLVLGEGDDCFSPVELLLAALAGCSAIDVDHITARRAEPTRFEVTASGLKVSDDDGNRLVDLLVRFGVEFPDGPEGDAARDRLPLAITRSSERLCTVSRTIQSGTPVIMTSGTPA